MMMEFYRWSMGRGRGEWKGQARPAAFPRQQPFRAPEAGAPPPPEGFGKKELHTQSLAPAFRLKPTISTLTLTPARVAYHWERGDRPRPQASVLIRPQRPPPPRSPVFPPPAWLRPAGFETVIGSTPLELGELRGVEVRGEGVLLLHSSPSTPPSSSIPSPQPPAHHRPPALHRPRRRRPPAQETGARHGRGSGRWPLRFLRLSTPPPAA